MPSKAQLARGALAALREEFAARSALTKAADAVDDTKYTRDIQQRQPFTREQIEAEMRRQALEKAPEQKMLQGFYRGFAGEGGSKPDVFVTPQKRVADYYAEKRAAQTGREPHAEMILADPFVGRAYGHSTPGTGAQEPLYTRARKMREEDVVERTPLYAEGGPVTADHTQPDMADGGRLLADPNLYAAGGLVAAFKDGGAATGVFPQMKPHRAGHSGIGERMTEEALKFVVPQDTTDLALMAFPFGKAGKAAAAGLLALTPGEAEAGKAKTAVDLGRRALFGLRPTQEMAGRELAPVQRDLDKMRAELNKAERTAPKVEEKSITIDPGKGATKVTDVVQKVAETPVSRRTVLKSAASQVAQSALPTHSFADLMKPAEIVKDVVAPIASADALVPGLVAKAMKMGLDEDQVARFVGQNLPKGVQGAEKIDTGTMRYLFDAPYEFASNPSFEGASRLEVMRDILQQPAQGSPFQLRGALRGVQRENPDVYKNLKETATDIRDYGHEN